MVGYFGIREIFGGVMEIKIDLNIPPDLEQYIKEFVQRPYYIVFGLGEKFFKLIEYDGYWKIELGDKELPDIMTDLDDVLKVIKEQINESI